MLIEAIKPENFAHFPELILRHFKHAFARAPRTISACVTSSDMQGEMARVHRGFFRLRQVTAGNMSAFAGY